MSFFDALRYCNRAVFSNCPKAVVDVPVRHGFRESYSREYTFTVGNHVLGNPMIPEYFSIAWMVQPVLGHSGGATETIFREK
ncbi:MAG: hypothetical protein KC994_23405 [Candidatus Omnitrophica bacterium]|nr:hypothetical protein [Candidatus Omnitrophota bacterium]